MKAILAATLAVTSILTADRSPSRNPVAPASEPPVVATMTSSPLPGSPLEVTLTSRREGNVLTWLPPTHSGDSAVVGYAVIDGDSARYVGADVSRVVVRSRAAIAVASINGSGCSVATTARPTAADRVAQSASPLASR